MACSDYSQPVFFDAISEFAARDAFLCDLQLTFGGPEFALLFFGVVSVGLYRETGDVIMPAVVAIIIGGRAMSEIASLGLDYLTITLLVVVGVGPVWLLRKMGRI